MAEQDDIQIDESPAATKDTSQIESQSLENMVGYEQLEEKQEEIERLNFIIQQDKEVLAATQKQVADLNEAVKLAEEQTEKAVSDREKFADKSREFILKLQAMRDDMQDKDLKIEEYEAKMHLLA